MKILRLSLLLSVFFGGIVLSADAPKTVPDSPDADASQEIALITNQPLMNVTFAGMTETGVSIGTFLCGNTSVLAGQKDTGANFQADDCSIDQVQQAQGYDVSGGRSLQFFNNFTYWLKQKSAQEQSYQLNGSLSEEQTDAKMKSAGWVAMGAFSIVITTNAVVQQTIEPSVVVGAGEIKVVVQLLYNGNNLIQLWSQDVAVLKSGQSFSVAVSNSSDDLETALKAAQATLSDSYLSAISSAMQPQNRNEDVYNAALYSPRMVRIQVSSK